MKLIVNISIFLCPWEAGSQYLCPRVLATDPEYLCASAHIKIYELRGLSPQLNYTDWATPLLSGQSVPSFADRGCHVVNVTDPYIRIFGFLNLSRYFFFQVAPQLNSQGWVYPASAHIRLRYFQKWLTEYPHDSFWECLLKVNLISITKNVVFSLTELSCCRQFVTLSSSSHLLNVCTQFMLRQLDLSFNACRLPDFQFLQLAPTSWNASC
jgi:hypothetical protein